MKNDKIRFGIVGVCGGWGRGKMMVKTINSVPGCQVTALCDTDFDNLQKCNAELGVEHIFPDYTQMLEQAPIDAVFIATPMNLHAAQSIAALERNLHVLCEVPASVTLQESRQLVEACKKSSAVYMLAENYIYFRENLMVREMVRRGEFGSVYYGEGEYVHGLRALHEKTRWRRRWQVGVNGLNYGTHALGPLLQWFPGDRVARISCIGSGHHYVDAAGAPYEMEDVCVMMCKMESGGLLKIRNDLVSNGPGRTYYNLQGTGAVFESDRRQNLVWLESRAQGTRLWKQIKELEEEFLPRQWKEYEELASKSGHHGGDFIQMLDFVDAVHGKARTPLGIHEGMDMTLPGILSQVSIANDGAWVDVPDSRAW